MKCDVCGNEYLTKEEQWFNDLVKWYETDCKFCGKWYDGNKICDVCEDEGLLDQNS